MAENTSVDMGRGVYSLSSTSQASNSALRSWGLNEIIYYTCPSPHSKDSMKVIRFCFLSALTSWTNSTRQDYLMWPGFPHKNFRGWSSREGAILAWTTRKGLSEQRTENEEALWRHKESMPGKGQCKDKDWEMEEKLAWSGWCVWRTVAQGKTEGHRLWEMSMDLQAMEVAGF